MKTHYLLLGCVGLWLGGCRSSEEMCGHAREVSISLLRAEYAAARHTIADYEYDRYDAQLVRHVANIEAKFVDVCMAAAPPTRACLERIDDIAAAEQEYYECDVFDDKCSAPARKIRDEKVGDCKQPMEDLNAVLFEGVSERR